MQQKMLNIFIHIIEMPKSWNFLFLNKVFEVIQLKKSFGSDYFSYFDSAISIQTALYLYCILFFIRFGEKMCQKCTIDCNELRIWHDIHA